MPKFNFYGIKTPILSDSYQQLRSVQPGLNADEYLALAVRSAEAAPVTIETADDDVVVMQMTNDVEWHYRADDFEAFLKMQHGASRSGTAGELEVPMFFSRGDSRGLEEVVQTKALKIITGMVAKGAAQLLVEKMESGLETGLHRLNENFEFRPVGTLIKDKPHLLFIHGTNSDTNGAFKELKKNEAYRRLFNFYEGRVLSFEHKTLSESPVTNLIHLLNALPNDISVDIVSHSRGGIIADLLARCSNGALPFDQDEIKLISKNKDFQSLLPEATEANKAASGKNILVSKMVRVASPSAGTVLIDKRLDNLVNVLFNLIKLIPAAAACMPFTLFLDFVKAVVHERTDITVFPGVAAQIPGSPLIRILNNPNRKIRSELFVISGDVEHAGILKSMLVMSTNLYFGEAHDLVVNSNSMFKGTYRSINVKEHFEQEPSVNHFNYFANKKSQDALLAALINPTLVGSFYEELGETSQITKVHVRGVMGKKPVVYILPGIMGSNLETGSTRLWLNFLGIVDGILSRLAIDEKDIEATSIHNQTYVNLANYLTPDFDVIPFPYDWRMNLEDAANRLAGEIGRELDNPERTNHEFHFIAHSMGGLVLRAMLHTHKDLWKKITESKRTKVLMLGVPNEGSYGTVRILLGKDSIIRKLALLDFVHSKTDLLDIFKEYPGLVQLLPCNATGIFKENTWQALKAANNEFTAIPPIEALQKGLDFYDSIKDTDYDNDIFRYIAGQDESTPENFSIENGKIIFTATTQGDGRVLWSTIPSKLSPENIYYVAADHGGLPKHVKAFEGYRELLQKGTTELAALSRTRPVARGRDLVQIMPDSDYVTIPTEAELNESLLGMQERAGKTGSREIIDVSVINGDLVHSNYPVVVGHFKGDGIIYAEKYLDRALNLKLSEYHGINNYPGDIGSHLVILNDNTGANNKMICEGGVVVGLGEFGSLTENRLLFSLTQAFLTLSVKYNELLSSRTGTKEPAPNFGISSLLVGSDFAGLRISTAVKTILFAVVQANEKMEALSKSSLVSRQYRKIDRIEIIEIYQHKAIQIGRVIKNFLGEDGFSNFRLVPPVLRIGSGALKIIVDEMQQDTWHRLEVSVYQNKCLPAQTNRNLLPIRFISITDKAHADEELLPGNRVIVEALIRKVAKHAQWDKTFSQALYELLIPNEFKGYGSNLRNLVLIVDEQTARYPWELLQDPNGISEKPMIIATGIVRQLKTGKQRQNVITHNSNTALVIGNPMTEGRYPSLPAAEAEANAVFKILQANGLEMTLSIGEQDIDIVQKILTKTYKIIHIASHGIVGKTADDPTGVVIGKEMVLTAGDFDQIRIVPEFVFINCCSSNEYDLEIADQMRRKYELAASVGTQLIEMGVKAVIVTGWEIDDVAAGLFSDTFYTAMFGGKSFGDAVRAAREKTYNQHSHTNTWGAYQCYGDPFYSFNVSGAWSKNETFSFVDAVEALNALDNLISEITSVSKRTDFKGAEKRINAIMDGLQPSWKLDGRILEKLATLYRTLGMFKEAIIYYEQLFNLENATYTVRALEQYYNIRIRYAIKQFKSGEITQTAANKSINDAIKSLQKLEGQTFERYSLIAASYRRLFDIDDKKFKVLVHAAEYYRRAYEYSEKTFGEISFYPYFNWLHFAILLAPVEPNHPCIVIPANRDELDAKALKNAKLSDNMEPDFYKKAAVCSLHLASLLSAEGSPDIVKYSRDIVSGFKDAWNRDGSASEKDSFIAYLDFVILLLQKLPAKNKKARDEKAGTLRNVITDISK